MNDPQELVCVFTATNPAQAELVRNLLESEGIRAATADTHHPFPGLAIAPAEVFVERTNEASALQIIAEHRQVHSDNELDDESGDSDEPVGDESVD